MSTTKLPTLATVTLLTCLGSARTALAEPTCTTVEAFNAYMDGVEGAVTTLELQFDVTGVNPADFPGGKGCLAEFDDERCTSDGGYAAVNVKVYGVHEPAGTHPSGSLKSEWASYCCATPICEGAASHDPSVVFATGAEQCTVTFWLDPTDYGYHIDCGGSVFDSAGSHGGDLRVTQASILARTDGGWALTNAVSTWNQICYEPPVVDPVTPGFTIGVLEDVTAAAPAPDTVYADVADLSVESGDSEIYLKFDLSSVPGQVTRAEIAMHRADGTSSEGSGGDVFLVPNNAWSETTLTWNNRPAAVGGSLARVSPVSAYDWYTWDVTAAITGLGIHSFAIVPTAADTNGSHFFSKEGSPTFRPELRIEYVVVDADADGYPAGPDCNDASAAVHPGAAELCNGVDDDCNGAVDEDCPGAGGSGPGAGGTGPGAGGSGALDPGLGSGAANGAGEEVPGEPGGDCGCRLGAVPARSASKWLLVLASGIVLARRRVERARRAPR